jgi:hypothetical protein
VFSKEVKEITLICSKQVSSLDTPTLKTTLGLRTCFCTTMEKLLDCPWCFWYKVFKVGRKNSMSYVIAILIVKEWPTQSTTKLKSLNRGSNIRITILWALVGLKDYMKSRKGLRTMVTCLYMLALNCFTFMCMSISSMPSIYACNFKFSLKRFTYNLIAKVRAFDNN